MKNLYFLAGLLFVIASLISCKKDHKPTTTNINNNTFYKVNFDLSGATSNTAANAANSRLKLSGIYEDTVRHLYYKVYNSSKKVVSEITQSSNFTSYGHIRDSLQAGNYTVAMGMGQLFMSDTDLLITGDVFFKKFPLTVSNSPVSSTVVLPRIVARLDVNIEDAVPASATNIAVTINDFKWSYSIWDETPKGSRVETFNFPLTTADVGIKNKKLSIININTVSPFSVTIKATGPNNYSATKTVSNIICTPNTKTTLTGKLFDVGSYPNSFTIKFNEAFGTDTIRVGF